MSKQYLFYPKKGVISDSSASIQLLQPSTNDILTYQTSTNWFNTGANNFIKTLNLFYTGAQGIQGPTGFQGPSSGGGNTITNFGNTRVLTSDGTATGLLANTGLTYNGNLLNIGGDISPTGLFIYSSVFNPVSNIIDTTKQVNLVSYNTSWTTIIAGTGNDQGNAIAVDINGNSYVTGNFSLTGAFYNSDGTVFTTLSGSGNNECFVAEYGPTGMVQWVTKISSTNNEQGNGISVDTSGNSYVIGQYATPPLTVYNSDGTVFKTLSGSGTTDCFIVKYGQTGMGQWATNISSTSNDFGYGVAVDTNGNSYVTGSYRTPSTVYNSDGSAYTTLFGSGSSDDCFIVKYGPTGMGSFASKISGAGIDRGLAIDVDTIENSYITGSYNPPTTIYNSDGTSFTTLFGSGSSLNCFVVKYGPTGMGQWSSIIAGTGNDTGNGISVDTSGNSYVIGQYTQPPLTVYNSDGTAFRTLFGSGSLANCFVVKYGPTGMGQWSSIISGTGSDTGNAISVDGYGNSYVTGSYASPATVYNSDGTTFKTLFGSGSTTNCFIVKYGPTGMGILATNISGTGIDDGNGIASDNMGNIYVTGRYAPPATVYNFDDTPLTTLSGSGTINTSNCFIVKLGYGYTGYVLNDLTNDPSNNGKTLTLINRNQGLTGYTGPVINVTSTVNNVYITNTVNNSSVFTFYNGQWYLNGTY